MQVSSEGVPRAGGDEPVGWLMVATIVIVFPARAGMNRHRGLTADPEFVFPARAGMNRQIHWVVEAESDAAFGVFPARAGMNRPSSRADCATRVFPARAGMNRLAVRLQACRQGVPRAGGDEPVLTMVQA